MCRASTKLLLILGMTAGAAVIVGCVGTSGGDSDDAASSATRRQFPLDTLPTSTVTIKEHIFRVWLALGPEQREEGMMFVSEGEVADDQGMLFVFPDERYLGFWMKNTIISLDIAFARTDGTIVTIRTMPPLTLRTFSSIEPAMFALEVEAGTFERLGICEGDLIDIPEDVFKAAP